MEALRREAQQNGASAADLLKIVSDGDVDGASGDRASQELDDGGEGKATYLIKFWRENGRVVFEKSVRNLVIRTVKTDMRLYPVAYFNWTAVKNSFHGASPITGMVPNQQFINRAYAMVMKHMTDTAFSKVVYDKSRIPEWSNEVGEAIAVVGAANVADAVSVVGTGTMQDGYLTLIETAVGSTKELAGATETALGNIDPTNTSAILALKETSRVTLEQIVMALGNCIEDMANIWVDMMCAYYADERLVPYVKNGETVCVRAGLSALKSCLVRAHVDISDSARYSEAASIAILDKLLDGGYISSEQYITCLPEGLIIDRERLLKSALETEGGLQDGRESRDA